MKMKSTPVLFLAVSLLSACQSSNQKNAGAFLSKIAAMNVSAADVQQTTYGPFYNHRESIDGLSFDGTTGKFSVSNLKAEFNIPFPVSGVPLLSWSFSASAISGEKSAVSALPAMVDPNAPAPIAVPATQPAK